MPRPTRGKRYAADVRSSYALNETEEVLVDEIAWMMDAIDGLPKGDVQERRLMTVVLLRATAQLALPQAGTGERPSSTSTKARQAVNTRWRREVERDAAS